MKAIHSVLTSAVAVFALAIGLETANAIDLPKDHGKKAVTSVTDELWPDGKLQRKVEVLPSGSQTVTSYDRDGKTILLKQEFRKDNSLAYQRVRMLDGSTCAIRYKTSGKKQMVRNHDPKTGAFNLTHYRMGASEAVWFESQMNLNSDEATWKYFAKDGTTVTRVVNKDDMTVTVAAKDGSIQYVQTWKKESGQWNLETITDGAKTKRYKFTLDKAGIVEQQSVEHLKADGTVDRTDASNSIKAPAAWVDGFDDDPTFPE